MAEQGRWYTCERHYNTYLSKVPVADGKKVDDFLPGSVPPATRARRVFWCSPRPTCTATRSTAWASCALFGLRTAAIVITVPYDFTDQELQHILANLLAAHPLQPGDDLLEHAIETCRTYRLRMGLGRLKLSDTTLMVEELMGYT
ncbi:unnamed protein product [Vitrella brassicaformis CCMP3155]|uniref:Uncharacterized protein n=1 Tax=Vitrella brassicaformis (strain CCMP3155) TaxID=1169540 RepID=A0A0G4F8T6_VITBC|nr:unnamed protein product [Vitrella brassicaformis CCMP3155]|eukprot:CEM09163.1 unnamed protein product [Vitrella brassicaformis CCMP3155]